MKASDDREKCDLDCLHLNEGLGKSKLSGALRKKKKNTDCYRGKHKGGTKMPYNSKTLGMIIGTERVKKGMTQDQLSGLAGISRSHLAALESGQKSPNVDTFWRIAEALSMKPSRLLAMMENYGKG